MLKFVKCKPLRLAVVMVTLLAFCPTSVEVWNFIPAEMLNGAHAQAVQVVPEDTGTDVAKVEDQRIEFEIPKPVPVKKQRKLTEPEALIAKYLESVEAAKATRGVKVAQAGAITSALGAAVLSAGEVLGPLGGTEASQALTSADELRASGNYSSATMAYVQAIDTHPGTHEAMLARAEISAILNGIRQNTVDLRTMAAFESQLASYAPTTLDGKTTLATYYGDLAVIHREKANTAQARWYAERAMAQALPIIQQAPGSYLHLEAVPAYFESARILDGEAYDAAIGVLNELAKTKEPSIRRFAVFRALSDSFQREENNQSSAGAYAARMLADVNKEFFTQTLNSESVPGEYKALMGFEVGTAYYRLGRYETAIEEYEIAKGHAASNGETRELLDYMTAVVSERINFMDPTRCAEDYLAFLSAHPDGYLAAHGMWRVGNVYFLAGDYAGAVDFYRSVAEGFQWSSKSRLAEKEIAYIMQYLYDSVEVVIGPQQSGDDKPVLAQNCGPEALQQLLSDKGIDARVDELATLAKTDAQGTTMQGLVDAALAKGLPLTGVDAVSVDDVNYPFIAYVNENHFVLVRDKQADGIHIWDGPKGERVVPAEDWVGMWRGKALVTGEAAAKPLEVAYLIEAKGGTHDEPDGMAIPSAGGYGESAGSPFVGTSVSSPGVHPVINQFETALYLSESDLAMSTRGDYPLVFARSFGNENGYLRGEHKSTGNPQSNVVGAGWSHNLNIYLKMPGEQWDDNYEDWTVPSWVWFADGTGVIRQYEYSNTTGGYRYYYASTTAGTTEEKGWVLKHNESDGTWELVTSGLMKYQFETTYTGVGSLAKLTKIADISGNETTFSYNSGGRLTKVASPLGDTYHLLLSYSGSLITKVELKNSSTVLQTMQYAYDTVKNELTKITDNGGKEVKYFYATNAGSTKTRAITKITDKGNVDTTLAWVYDSDGTYWRSYKIDLTDAASLKQTYDKSLSTYVNTNTEWDSATLLAKDVETPVSGDTSRGRYSDNYLTSSTYENWGYEYDTTKDQTKQVGPGSTTLVEKSFTSLGRLATVSGNDGVDTTLSYATGGLTPTKVTNTAAIDTNILYDTSNRPTKVTSPAVGSAGVVYTYNAYGQISTATNPSSQVVTYTYDTNGRVTSAKDPLNNETKYEYDVRGNVTKVTDPRNKSSYVYFDYSGCGGCSATGGVMTKTKDALNNETYFYYDAIGRKTKVTDALSRSTDYFYDSMNQVTKVESPSGSGTYMTMAYDKQGKVTSQTDFEGKTISYYYDFQSLLTKQTDSVGDYVQFTYDSKGQQSTVKDGNNNVTDYDYDADGRLTKINYANSKSTLYFYDTTGRVTKVGAGASGTTDPTEYWYNATTGLLSKVRYTAGATTSDAYYFYDDLARTTKITDWLDGTNGLRYAFDAAGRLTRLTDYDNSYLTYVYDAAGNVLSMTDYHGYTTTYTYTDLNQLSTLTAPGTKVWDFDYNALGQQTQYSAPNGTTSVYGYDNRNRMTKIEHKDGATVLDSYAYTLEKNGNITKTTNADGSYWDYFYDGRYRLTKAERFNSGATIKAKYQYTYDAADNMLTKVEPFFDDFNDGNYTGWSVWGGTWTAANNLAENTGTAGATLAKTTTDADVEMTLRYRSGDTSNSLYWGYVWIRYVDGSNRIRLSFEPGKVVLLEQYSGAYTTLDQDTSFTTTQDTWYNYRIVADGAHIEVWRNEDGQMPVKVLETNSSQVTTTNYIAFATSANSTSDFDNIRVLSDSLSSTTTMAYNSGNELTSVVDGNGTTTYAADAWGRMTSKSRSSYTGTYYYNYGSMLTKVSSNFPDEGTVTYQVGADMKRRQRDDGTITKFNWDAGWNEISEESSGGTLTMSYVPGLAEISGSNPTSGTARYYYRDNIESNRSMLDASKAEVAKLEYDPFGGKYVSVGINVGDGFTGHTLDTTSGLYFAPLRHYAPSSGRWGARDPFGMVDGPNQFSYGRPSPISGLDRLGGWWSPVYLDIHTNEGAQGLGSRWQFGYTEYLLNSGESPGGEWISLGSRMAFSEQAFEDCMQKMGMPNPNSEIRDAKLARINIKAERSSFHTTVGVAASGMTASGVFAGAVGVGASVVSGAFIVGGVVLIGILVIKAWDYNELEAEAYNAVIQAYNDTAEDCMKKASNTPAVLWARYLNPATTPPTAEELFGFRNKINIRNDSD